VFKDLRNKSATKSDITDDNSIVIIKCLKYLLGLQAVQYILLVTFKNYTPQLNIC